MGNDDVTQQHGDTFYTLIAISVIYFADVVK
jgi:hypothetical protein